MRKHSDKYFLLCIIVIITLVSMMIVHPMDDTNDTMVGIVSDCSSSQNGYVFSFTDCSGESIRCFSRSMPYNESIYEINGSFSKDNSIFFVTELHMCQTE